MTTSSIAPKGAAEPGDAADPSDPSDPVATDDVAPAQPVAEAIAWLTAGEPGITAGFRETPDDFCVWEIPYSPPPGHGGHLILTLRKRGFTTFELCRRVGRVFGKRSRDVGLAGLKDARAVTVQRLSVEHRAAIDPLDLRDRLRAEGAELLCIERHPKKLRRGALWGNAFRLRLTGVGPGDEARARRVLATLERTGVPNRFGLQRYGGRIGRTAELGRLLLAGDPDAFLAALLGEPVGQESPAIHAARTAFDDGDLERAISCWPRSFEPERRALVARTRGRSAKQAIRSIPKRALDLYVSAFQSRAFDRLLNARIRAGRLDRIGVGEVAHLFRNGAAFVCRTEEDTLRAATFEIAAAGPLFGTKLLATEGEAALTEARALEAAGAPRGFEGALCRAPHGARRAYRVPLTGLSCTREADDLWLAFRLPKGTYATAVLAELFKRRV